MCIRDRIFAVSLGVWYWQQTKIDDYKQQVVELTGQSSVSQTDVSSDDNYQTSYISDKGAEVIVYNPINNSVVVSPFKIVGEVPGSWSFEADFPIKLFDSNNKVIGEAVAKLHDDWMTEEFVLFSADMSFSKPETENGTLILYKDNPSGLTENEDSVKLSVRFN